MGDTDLHRLRRQRNQAAVSAVLFILVSMSITLPRALRSRQELKDANQELTRLQAEIVAVHQKTREMQAQTIAAQEQIKLLQQAPPK